jgi:hypothetical protein
MIPAPRADGDGRVVVAVQLGEDIVGVGRKRFRKKFRGTLSGCRGPAGDSTLSFRNATYQEVAADRVAIRKRYAVTRERS